VLHNSENMLQYSRIANHNYLLVFLWICDCAWVECRNRM